MRAHRTAVLALAALGAVGALAAIGLCVVLLVGAVPPALVAGVGLTALGASDHDAGPTGSPSPRPVDDVRVTRCAVSPDGVVTVRVDVTNRTGRHGTYVGTVEVTEPFAKVTADAVFASPALAPGISASTSAQTTIAAAVRPTRVTCRVVRVDVVMS